MIKLPVRLKNDPIADCTIEMRFTPASDSVAEVLPGLLFNSFKEFYPNTESTPETQLPRIVRKNDPDLRFRPIVKFAGSGGYIGIGDSVINISFVRPYPGWTVAQPRALSLFTKALQTDLIKSTERLSIVYNNIISHHNDPIDLSPLECKFEIGRGLKPRGPGTTFRTEFANESTVTIVQISTAAKARITIAGKPQQPIQGVLLMVDTIWDGNVTNEDELREKLSLIHRTEKEYFYSIITDKTRDALGPEWE